jgi:glycosyltransferase involved in cell wall biosynthesis
MNVSFIIPTRNNLPYLKLAYGSIRKLYPQTEIIILDDNSTDGTREWVESNIGDSKTVYYRNDGRQVGHTILYNKGVELCDSEVFTIFHADMVCGANYVENLMKHLKPQGVVSATRIEPPLHPPGKEKIVKDFGTYAEDFRQTDFDAFVRNMQQDATNKNTVTRGIFAPWMMYKADFLAIGGHDKYFAPFPYEDSDIFQRFILKGYDIKQSRDAFVYHFTCRGHRWTEKVQKDDHFYKLCCAKNSLHFIRKWGNWIENDEFSYPVRNHLYDIGLVVKNCPQQLLGMLEPWCSTIYCDADIQKYITDIQPGTPFDLKRRVKPLDAEKTNTVLVSFDGNLLSNEGMKFVTQLSKVLTQTAESGDIQPQDLMDDKSVSFEHDIFKVEVRAMDIFDNILVNGNEYGYKFVEPSKDDPYCLNELFRVFEHTKTAV